VVVPRNNNHFYMKLAARSLYEPLISDGVRIFERRGPFSHAKAMLVDNEWAYVGSSNCDVRSFRLNYELDLAVTAGPFVADLMEQFKRELAESDEIELNDVLSKSLAIRIAENACALLTPIL
jgi:cardiolipin synthase